VSLAILFFPKFVLLSQRKVHLLLKPFLNVNDCLLHLLDLFDSGLGLFFNVFSLEHKKLFYSSHCLVRSIVLFIADIVDLVADTNQAVI
jgi:hypothetical protein